VHHHRAHHRYTDTDKDPYNASRGFWFSHICWLIGLNTAAWGDVDISDLKTDPVVCWQRRYYTEIAILGDLVLPIAIAHFGWDDWQGGLLYGAILRTAFFLQCTFLVNSLAHMPWAEYRPYSDKGTATNVPLVAFLVGGEGNHNFHHAFPMDYRNGIQWFELDWSQTFIWCCLKLGLAWDPVTVSPAEVEKARMNRQQRDVSSEQLEVPYDLIKLPVMSWNAYLHQVNKGRYLICVNGVVYDVSKFMAKHPGGSDILQQFVGKDATDGYLNGVHRHSSHADAILASLHCGVIQQTNHRKIP
jgi:stearoyl-CoA desaturase (Delta-9 desaturase)